MPTLEVLKSEIARQEARDKSKAWREYQKTLRRIADGKKVDPLEVKTALELVGRTVGELDLDLSNLKERDRIRDAIKQAEAVQPDLAALQVELDALKAEKQAFLDSIIPKIEAVVERKTRLASIVAQGSGNALKLRDTCNDPGLRLEAELIEQEIRELRARETQLQFALPEYRDAAWLEKLSAINTALDAALKRRDEITAEQEHQ